MFSIQSTTLCEGAPVMWGPKATISGNDFAQNHAGKVEAPSKEVSNA